MAPQLLLILFVASNPARGAARGEDKPRKLACPELRFTESEAVIYRDATSGTLSEATIEALSASPGQVTDIDDKVAAFTAAPKTCPRPAYEFDTLASQLLETLGAGRRSCAKALLALWDGLGGWYLETLEDVAAKYLVAHASDLAARWDELGPVYTHFGRLESSGICLDIGRVDASVHQSCAREARASCTNLERYLEDIRGSCPPRR